MSGKRTDKGNGWQCVSTSDLVVVAVSSSLIFRSRITALGLGSACVETNSHTPVLLLIAQGGRDDLVGENDFKSTSQSTIPTCSQHP